MNVTNKGPAIFIIVLVLGIAAFLVFDLVGAKRAAPGPAPRVDQSTASRGIDGPHEPPPGAPRVPDGYSPAGVMLAVAAQPAGRERRREAMQWSGLWVHDSGWEGEVSVLDVSENSIGIRFHYPTQALETGGFWVVASMPIPTDPAHPLDIGKGDQVHFGGRIIDVVTPADGAPNYTVMLSDVWIEHRSGR